MKKAEIEAKAREMGVNLTDPYARQYIKAVLEGEHQRNNPDPHEYEPADASGYTEDFNCVVIRRE